MTIVVVILVLVVVAAYLVWLRSKVQQPVSPKLDTQQEVVITTTPEATSETDQATQSEEATGSMKEKSSTSSPSSR